MYAFSIIDVFLICLYVFYVPVILKMFIITDSNLIERPDAEKENTIKGMDFNI